MELFWMAFGGVLGACVAYITILAAIYKGMNGGGRKPPSPE